jgi:O-antigen/teichoic acid export membrane protein
VAQGGHFGRVVGSLGWTLAGEVMFAAGQFGMLVVMARLGSEAALGRYALGIAIATPLFVITSLHLRPTYVVSDDSRFEFGDYFGLRLIGAPLALVMAAAWSFAIGHDTETLAMIALVAVTRLSELVSDMCHAAAGRAEKLRRVGIARALRGMLLLAATAGALVVGASPVVAVGCGAIVGLMLTLLYDLPTARQFVSVRPRFDRERMLGLTKLAAPVGLAGGLLGLTMNTPAYVLEQVAGLEELGRYTAVTSVIYISGVLNMAMGSAAIPRLARLYEADTRGFVRVLLRLVGLAILLNGLIFAGCIVAGRMYLEVAYGEAYGVLEEELFYAGVIVIATGLANLLSQTLVAMKFFRLQFVISVATFIAGIGLSVWLVSTRGLVGGVAALGAIVAVRLVVYATTVGGFASTRRSNASDGTR